MSELTRKLRERVEQELSGYRRIEGDSSVAVRAALWVLQEAEAIEDELSAATVSTERAAELTGWSTDTLRQRAREATSGGRNEDL